MLTLLATPMTTTVSVKDHVRAFRQWFQDRVLQDGSFALDIHHLGDEIVDCYQEHSGSPAIIYKIKILDTMRSHYDNSHAGALTTLVDWLTHVAGAADPKFWPTDRESTVADFKRVRDQLGLSRRLSLQYIKEVPLNIDVFVKCVMLENSKSRQYFTVEIYDKSNLYVRATHDKIKLYKRVKGAKREPDEEDAFGKYQKPVESKL